VSKYDKELRDRIEQNLRMFDYPIFDDGDIEALPGEITRLTAELTIVRIQEDSLLRQIEHDAEETKAITAELAELREKNQELDQVLRDAQTGNAHLDEVLTELAALREQNNALTRINLKKIKIIDKLQERIGKAVDELLNNQPLPPESEDE